MPVVLVPHRHHLTEKAHFHIDDWLWAKVTEDALCQEALGTQVWEGFMVEALLDSEWFNHSHFEMKLLASFTSRNVKTRRKKTLSFAMQFSQLYLIKK